MERKTRELQSKVNRLQRKNAELFMMADAIQSFATAISADQIIDRLLEFCKQLTGARKVFFLSTKEASKKLEEGICEAINPEAYNFILQQTKNLGITVCFNQSDFKDLSCAMSNCTEIPLRGDLERFVVLIDLPLPENSAEYVEIVSKITNPFVLALKEKENAEQLIKSENALREIEQRLVTTLASIGDAVIATDLDGKISFMNAMAEALTGWTLLDASQKHVLDVFKIINENSRKPVESPVARVLKKGLIVGLANHTVLMRKKGTEVAIDGSGAPIIDKDGKIAGVVLIFRDITERKKAEEALRKLNEELEERVRKRTEQVSSERQRLYNVLETLPAYVVLLDKDYRVPFANKVFRERFGESHGRRCHDFLFKRDSPCENCETYKVLKTDKWNHWEWTGPDCRNYDVYDYPFVESDGSTLILEMGIDITDRKKAEEAAQESAKKLKDAERLAAIGATAGMVGHDIRNPLQAITSDVYLAKTDLASTLDSEEKKNALESLEEIEKNVVYINKIVADLQDFARPLNPREEETDLKRVIDDLLAKNGLPENVKISVKVETGKVVVDSTFINRIMYNLVNNAVQAMPKGGKLAIHTFKEANDTIITVKDTGVGIPDSVKGKLFTPMFTTKSKGQGFGLVVIKRMTEALGGTVSFESQEGKGTTFIIRLPPKR